MGMVPPTFIRLNKRAPLKEEHPSSLHPEMESVESEPPQGGSVISEYTGEPCDPGWFITPPAPSVDRRLIGKEYR